MGLPSETLQFTGFSHLAQQMSIRRVYGGIHFQFDTDASMQTCGKVAEYVNANFMRPRQQGDCVCPSSARLLASDAEALDTR